MPVEHVASARSAKPSPNAGPSFAEAVLTWAKIGLIGFGGPAGQIALMHRIIVDEKRWIDEPRFLHALNYCMLLPGPEAQQLAVYLGWLLHRTKGGLAAGILFVLPGALVMLGLSILYVLYGRLPLVEGLFFGLKAAVLAVVIDAVLRIGRRSLRNAWMVAIAGAGFVGIFFFNLPFPLIVLSAAAIGFFAARSRPDLFAGNGGHALAAATPAGNAAISTARRSAGSWLSALGIGLALWFGPTLAAAVLLGGSSTFADIGVFFSKMAVVTFGGAYAVLSYVAQQAVDDYGWLGAGEMLTGLGLAETTPGPLIMVVQFVAFLGAYRHPGPFDPMTAGILGGMLATWVTFVPCFLWIFLGAPWVERLRDRRRLNAALAAITAAVVGVILNLALWFALHVLFGRIDERWFGPVRLFVPEAMSLDAWALLVAGAAMLAMLRFKVGMLPTLAGAAVAGMALRLL
ncbi:MAG: chromate efflux transporter [Rhodospirillales bacterium]|nr:chromate efflux transporter [Rhodospirillales bacterium]